MLFPFGALLASTSMMANNKEKDKKCKDDNEKCDNTKNVRDIIVTYEDGSCRTIKHGIAADVISENNMVLDHVNCTDEQFVSLLRGLTKLARDKGIVD